MTPLAGMVYAHHALVVALPFFVPALLAVLAVGGVMWRDRHSPEGEGDTPGPPGQAPPDRDGEDGRWPTRS